MGSTKLSEPEKTILLLCDDWSQVDDGIVGVNRSLALNLIRYTGVNVYSTVLKNQSSLNASAKKDAESRNIKLLYASENNSEDSVYKRFNENPKELFPSITSDMPAPTHIVGHCPITASAALQLKESIFPQSQVILFYHVIPGDISWLQDDVPYDIPTDTELIQMAQKANVVFSVSEKMHWYFKAKFHNRAQSEIDHQLFLPQCGEDIFNLQDNTFRKTEKPPKILAMIGKTGMSVWEGIDIAALCVKKVADMWKSEDNKPPPTLILGGIPQGNLTKLRDYISEYTVNGTVNVELRSYEDKTDLLKDLAEADLCIVTSRAEPFGFVGLQALSAGVPTLLPEDSAISTMVSRLTAEPDYFLVPITPSCTSFRQDASLWRDRVLAILNDPNEAWERTQQLKSALRRDDTIRKTHDTVISYCLGGIKLKHEAVEVELAEEEDPEKELEIQRNFNTFLLRLLKQCWRMKHHPLAQKDDVPLLPVIEDSLNPLLDNVTNKIEERDRRILGIDETSDSFLVYCPTAGSLMDLWAMCDVINNALCQNLLIKNKQQLLSHFGLKDVTVRTVISGPELLQYKNMMFNMM